MLFHAPSSPAATPGTLAANTDLPFFVSPAGIEGASAVFALRSTHHRFLQRYNIFAAAAAVGVVCVVVVAGGGCGVILSPLQQNAPFGSFQSTI